MKTKEKPAISVDHKIVVTIKGEKIEITRKEAEALRDSISDILNDKPNYVWPQPTIIYKDRYISAPKTNPYPYPYDIWCGSSAVDNGMQRIFNGQC